MSTAHLYRLVTDEEGNLLGGAQVSVCSPATTVPITDKLYSDQALTNPQPNPYTTQDGVVDLYLPSAQTVCLVTTYGSVTRTVDYLDVLPPAELVLATPTFPVVIENDAYPNAILQMQDANSAMWVDPDAVAPADAVVEVVAGANIDVNDANPAKPVVSLAATFTAVGMNWRGFWVSSASYAFDDVVLDAARLFVCRSATASTLAPLADTAHWTEIAAVHDAAGRLQAALPLDVGDVATKGYSDAQIAAQMAYRGTWSTAGTYAVNDVVLNAARLYLCAIASPPSAVFPASSFVEIAAVHDNNGRLQAADPNSAADLVSLGYFNANAFRNPPSADLAVDLGATANRWRRIYVGSIVTPPNTQTLSTPGGVVIDASKSDASITLQANATSSSVINAATGQLLRITFIQDGTGGRTITWPANARFADNSTGPKVTSANTQVTVEFRYDGTNWIEVVRSPLLGSAGPVGPPNNPAANVLTDFSFDRWNGNALTAWAVTWASGTPVISRIQAPASYDDNGVSIAFGASGYQVFENAQFHVTPGQVWQVSAWAQGSGTAPQLNLQLVLAPSGGTPEYFASGSVVFDMLLATSLSSGYHLYSGSLLIPNGFGEAKLGLRTLGGAGDSVQIDRATLMPANPPTTFNGIPVGGAPGQFLIKNSNTDYDATWSPPLSAAPTLCAATPAAQGSGVWTEYAALTLSEAGAVPFSNGAFLPSVTSYYEICFTTQWPGNATGRRLLALSPKGTAPTVAAIGASPANASVAFVNGTYVQKLTAGVSYTLWAMQDCGSSLSATSLAVSVGQVGQMGPTGPKGDPGALIRQVSTITTGSTLGASSNTDYVYLCNAPATHTLPSAVGNSNRYTVKNRAAIGTNPVITVVPQSGQTIDGQASVVIPLYSSIDLIPDGSNWWLI